MRKSVFVFFTAAILSIAAAAETHKVTLFQDSVVNGTTLKPGEYKLTLDNGKAVLSQGNHRVEAQVTVQPGDSKFGGTTVRYDNSDGKMRVSEIRLGGTKSKVVFAPSEGVAAGGQK